MKSAVHTGVSQARGYLRPSAVDQHQVDAETVQESDVMNNIGKIRVQRGFARDDDDKSATPVRVDIGRTVPEPPNMLLAFRGHDLQEAGKAARLAY